MQTGNASFNSESAKASKAIDWLFAVSGWPIVYSVVKSYALADAGALLLSQFSAVRAWGNMPKLSAAEVKGRPEGGAHTIGKWSFTVLDKGADAAPAQDRRSISNLVSRAAYVLGNRTDLASGSAATGTLTSDLAAGTTASFSAVGTGFSASGGNVYVGQECIKYVSASVASGVTTFSTLTRGYLLTQATTHRGPRFQITAGNVVQIPGTKVYNFLPNVYRRPAYLFRGYQSMANTSTFLVEASGTVTGDSKDGPQVTFDVSDLTWELYVNGSKRVVNPTFGWPKLVIGDDDFNTNSVFGAFYDPTGVSYGQPSPATGLYTNHYALKLDSEWVGVSSVILGPSGAQRPSATMKPRGLNHTAVSDHGHGSHCTPAWTNVDFSANPYKGTEPVDLLRQLMTSALGDGSNGAYDVYEPGIGCGVPQGLVDLAGMASVRAQLNWDTNVGLYFMFQQTEMAKKFLEEEVCKPFGLYLACGNDGKIKLVRPLHPQKFYVGGVNRLLRWTDASGASHDATITVGVYDGLEMAAEVQRALNASTSMPGTFGGSPFTCAYSTSNHQFTITAPANVTLVASGDNSWAYLGYAVPVGPGTSLVSAVVGNFAGPTVTQSDVLNLQEIDARDMQISSVVYEYDYDWDRGVFQTQAELIDAETVNLGDALGAQKYVIKAKGLITGMVSSAQFGRWSPWHGLGTPPAESCDLSAYPPQSTGVDALTWSSLVAKTLLDRYKVPPLKVKFDLLWGGGKDSSGNALGTRLEVGDTFKFTYTPQGVLADRESGKDFSTSARVFEVVSRCDKPERGRVEVLAISHRYLSYA